MIAVRANERPWEVTGEESGATVEEFDDVWLVLNLTTSEDLLPWTRLGKGGVGGA